MKKFANNYAIKLRALVAARDPRCILARNRIKTGCKCSYVESGCTWSRKSVNGCVRRNEFFQGAIEVRSFLRISTDSFWTPSKCVSPHVVRSDDFVPGTELRNRTDRPFRLARNREGASPRERNAFTYCWCRRFLAWNTSGRNGCRWYARNSLQHENLISIAAVNNEVTERAPNRIKCQNQF